MFFLKNNIFLLFSLLITFTSKAQTYNFKNYSTDDGLPQSQVLSIFQDSKGYMWFGTNSGGLAKFDGRKFITLNKNDGLADDNVFSIVEDMHHNLCFGTSNGLSIYNHFTFKNYAQKEGLKTPSIFKLLNDENKIWIGTQSGVYVYQDEEIINFDKDSILNNSAVWSIFIDKDKNIWFATQQNGLVYFNPKKNTFKHFNVNNGLMNSFVFSIEQMDDGTMLVGTLTGLNKISKQFEITEADEISANKNMAYWCILKNKNNNFYFGTVAEGLMNFSFKTNSKLIFNSSNGLTNTQILSLLKDREGNLWVGTGNGVYKYYNNKFTYYSKANGLLNNYVNRVGVDVNDNYWLSVTSNGVAKIKGNSIVNYKTDFKKTNSLPDNNINAILPTDDGKVYFGTDEGLSLFENETFKTLTNKVFNKKYIQCLFKDSKNKIWIGTTEGVFSISNGEISEEQIVNSFDTDGKAFVVFCIEEDKSGKIVFGLENGLLLYDGKKIKHITEKNEFVNTRVCSAIKDSKNNIWFGTAEGLYIYNNSGFKKINKQDSISFGFINFLQLDKNNSLLVGTNNGIHVLNLIDFFHNKITTRHLGKEDGLLSKESNFNASAIDREGRVLIGSANGLTIYDPLSDVLNVFEPKTNISDIKLFFGKEDVASYCKGLDSTSRLPKSLILPYSKNNLTFQFIGISLVAPEKVMYTYKLEGLDKDWSPAGNNLEATYPSLPPGKFTFMVKAMNNDGLWNEKPTLFSFEILPPWYKTWWFYTLCVLSLIIGIMFYNYTRTKKLIADKQKLEKIVDERTKQLREEKEKVEIVNKEVIEQKAEIEHKNIEITDSIKYAKNIQEALLPSLKETERSFKNCFILYQPKDIVSGDFFWYSQNENTKYIAAADCTGHGVPGAFMSIVGNTLLNEIVDHQKIQHPGDILLELHKGVKIALNQNHSESQRRDGMDIALCAFNQNSNIIEYSGANRPLWIYRKNKNYDLEIIKPTKSPIGGLETEEGRIYQNNSIEIFEGDVLYFFSDGFADQFGGPKGKKFMISNMQKLLLDNIELPMHIQKQNIKKAFDDWKNDTEQIDDVLVIGIRI
jgi:ligand-binding sensor domain-containing protein/serine phosphatase RsbU (regulator of sigma subunit)